MTHVQVFFRKSLSKATFERKLPSVSLALENFRLSLRHGRPSQQLLSSCYLTEVTAWYRSGPPNIKQGLAILERNLTGRVLFLTTITLNQQ